MRKNKHVIKEKENHANAVWTIQLNSKYSKFQHYRYKIPSVVKKIMTK